MAVANRGVQPMSHSDNDDGKEKASGRKSAFSDSKPPNRVVCCAPPSFHFIPYCTGGLAKVFGEIRAKVEPEIHKFGRFTNQSGRFTPEQDMPLLALRYRFVKMLGEGRSGVVVKAVDTCKGNSEVSIKILHLDHCKLGPQEVDIIRQLNQADPFNFSSMLKLQNTCMFDDHFCLVFDCYDPMPIVDCIGSLKNAERLNFVRQVAAKLVPCLGFLQQQNVIHADIKVDNILLARPGDPTSVKLVDFGNAIHCVQSERSLYFSNFEIQTLSYRAPEIIYGLEDFGMAIDLWSLGMVLGHLYLGKPFVVASSKTSILKQIVSILGPVPKSVFQKGKFFKEFEKYTGEKDQSNCSLSLMKWLSSDFHFCDFISGLLRFDPYVRLTPQQAAAHSFLAPVFGYRHLSKECYPSVPVPPAAYIKSPLIDKTKKLLSSLEILRRGTTPLESDKNTGGIIFSTKYDRLDLLRNRRKVENCNDAVHVPFEKMNDDKKNDDLRDTHLVKKETVKNSVKPQISSSVSDMELAEEMLSVSASASSSVLGTISSCSSSNSCSDQSIPNDSNLSQESTQTVKNSSRERTKGRDENYNLSGNKMADGTSGVRRTMKSNQYASCNDVEYNHKAKSIAVDIDVPKNRSGRSSSYSERRKNDESASKGNFSRHTKSGRTNSVSKEENVKEEIYNFRDSGSDDDDDIGLSESPAFRVDERLVKYGRRPQKEISGYDSRPVKNRLRDTSNEMKWKTRSEESEAGFLAPTRIPCSSSQASLNIFSPYVSKNNPPLSPKQLYKTGKNDRRGHHGIHPAPSLASLHSGIVESTPMVKGRKKNSINIPNFGNISPIAEQIDTLVSCEKPLPNSKPPSAGKRSRARDVAESRAKKTAKMSRRSLLVHEVFGLDYDEF